MKMSIMLAAVSTAVLMPVFAGTTTESDDKDLSSPMTVNVASSDVKIWTGTVTGSAKLTKTGTGTLVLKHDNSETFSGEIEVQGGAVRMDVAGGFGTGTLRSTVTPTAGKVYGFIFNADGATVANSISLDNTTARLETSYDLQAMTNVTLTGTITATAGGVTFYDGGRYVTLSLEGAVNATKKDVWFKNRGRVDIKAPFTCTNMRIYDTTTNSFVHFYPLSAGASHTITTVTLKQMSMVAEGENTLPYSVYSATCVTKTLNAFDIDLNGYDQKIQGLKWNSGETMGAAAPGAYIRSTGGPATLFIKSASTTGYFSPVDDVTLVVDGSGCTQVFANRTATTTGDIIVSNGVFRLTQDMSFPNVPHVYVCGGATFDDQSVVAGSLGGVETVTLEANAKFTLAATATAPFDFATTKLYLDSASQFTIPSGMAVEVAELWVDGVKQPNGTYVKGTPACLKGDGSLKVEAHNFTTKTWNGGAGTSAVSLAANWSGEEPDLTSGDMTANVTAGSEMTLDVDTKFMGLDFAASVNGFTIGGDHRLYLSSDGITIAAGTEPGAREWIFNVPMEVKNSADWTFPAGDTLKSTGGISGDGSITVSAGAVRLEGSNTFTGTLSLEGGSLSLKGVLGAPGDVSKLQQVSPSYPVTLDGVEIFKSCTLGNSSTALVCTPGSSNIIHGKIGGCILPTQPADSTLVIDGSMYIDTSSWTPGTQLKGTNIWICAPDMRGLNNTIRPSVCTVIYAVPTETFIARDWYLTYNTALSRFDVDNVCRRRRAYAESTSKQPMAIAHLEGDNSSCDLNGTTQTFNGCVGTKGRVYSETPAALVISPLAMNDYTTSKENWVLYADSIFGAQLQGPVALRFEPSGLLTNAADATTLTIAARAYESTGSLEVTNHTMIVAAGATFRQLSRVKAVEKGVFDLQSATDAFGDELTLELGGTAELKVAANTLMRVRTVIVNGVETHVRPGSYTTEQFKDKIGSAFEGDVTGDGFIRVTGAGTKLLLR